MKTNQIIPSLVLCNIALNNELELNSNLTSYNIKIYENINLLTEITEEREFTIVSRSYVPISACKETEIVSFRSKNDYLEYFAIILKNGNKKKDP